jgi:hypothetical protein
MTSKLCWVSGGVELYFHFPIQLFGVYRYNFTMNRNVLERVAFRVYLSKDIVVSIHISEKDSLNFGRETG